MNQAVHPAALRSREAKRLKRYPLTLRYSDLLGLLWIASNVGLHVWTMTAVLRQIVQHEPLSTSLHRTDD
jgi:ABC-type polysaccharide/polyol phosphate export permease